MITIILAIFLGAAIVGGGVGGIETLIEAPAKFKQYGEQYQWHGALSNRDWNKDKQQQAKPVAPAPAPKKKHFWQRWFHKKAHTNVELSPVQPNEPPKQQ